MTDTPQPKETLPNLLHLWYLEATQKIAPKNFNKKAQKPFNKLNPEQQFIDRYIATKLNTYYSQLCDEIIGPKREYEMDANRPTNEPDVYYQNQLIDEQQSRKQQLLGGRNDTK